MYVRHECDGDFAAWLDADLLDAMPVATMTACLSEQVGDLRAKATTA